MPDSDKLQPAPPEFYERIQRLIAAYPQYFAHLRGARLEISVRDNARLGKGVKAWAEVDTPDGPDEAARFDFKLWFAQDVWGQLDEYQRDALTFHELKHAGWDDKGKPLLLQHDAESFDDEIREYGFWWGPDALASLAAYEEMPPPHGAEGITEMAQGYQRPFRGGGHGSTGVGGGHGSTGVGGGHGSTGVRVAYSDPELVPGGDYHVADLGNGEVIELSPARFQALVQSIVSQLLAAAGG